MRLWRDFNLLRLAWLIPLPCSVPYFSLAITHIAAGDEFKVSQLFLLGTMCQFCIWIATLYAIRLALAAASVFWPRAECIVVVSKATSLTSEYRKQDFLYLQAFYEVHGQLYTTAWLRFVQTPLLYKSPTEYCRHDWFDTASDSDLKPSHLLSQIPVSILDNEENVDSFAAEVSYLKCMPANAVVQSGLFSGDCLLTLGVRLPLCVICQLIGGLVFS
jgi:hypothetical protein